MLWLCYLFVLKPLGLIMALSAVFGEGSGVKLDAVATPPAADAKVKILSNVSFFLYVICGETGHCLLVDALFYFYIFFNFFILIIVGVR